VHTEHTVNMEKNVKEAKSISRMFIEDFEVQNWKILEKTKHEILPKSGKLFGLYCFDYIFCHLIIGPSVVAFWRGTWDYSNIWLDKDLFSGDLTLSNLHCLTIGLAITSGIDLFHHNVSNLAGDVGTVKHSILRHVFSIIWGFGDVIMWKGLWDGVDHWFGLEEGNGATIATVTLLIGLTILTLSRTMKAALSMPIGIAVDNPEHQISCSTFLETDLKSSWHKRAVDCLISRILEIGVILTWHGFWTFSDIVTEEVYELSHTESTFFSLFVGLSGGFFLFVVQIPLLKFYHSSKSNIYSGYMFLVFNFFFNLAGVYITISSFRSSWYLMGIYFLPASPVASLVSAQVIGVLVLVSIRCISCLHAGVYRDFPSDGVLVTFHHTVYFYIKNINDKAKADTEETYAEETCEKLINGGSKFLENL